MSDPLSLSASIAGLVTLADLVFRATADYTKSVKGSQKEVSDLSREVRNLSCVLHNLSHVAFQLEPNASADETSYQKPLTLKFLYLHDCYMVLQQLQERLYTKKSHIESSSRLRRIGGQLRWPFAISETKELLERVLRSKQTIDTALAADNFQKLELCLSRQEESNSLVQEIKATVTRILESQQQESFSRKKLDVIKFFRGYTNDYHAEFDTNIALRHPMSGLWLTQGAEFLKWKSTPGSKMWLSGIPGAGKSVIAALVSKECLELARDDIETAAAFHFSVYRDQSTHTPESILTALSIQLALKNSKAFGELHAYYNDLNGMNHFSRAPSAKELVAVLHRMCFCFNRVFIIADGLDECQDFAEATAKSLIDLVVPKVNHIVSLAVLSRDEISLREILAPEFHNIEISAHIEDIQLYVASELELRIQSRKLRLNNLRLKDEILVALVHGAKGMFRWVVCQLDHICGLPQDQAKRQALKRLPPTLPATYERILDKIGTYDESVQRTVQKAFALISLDPPHWEYKLTFQEICEAVSVNDNSNGSSDDEDMENMDDYPEDDLINKEDILLWCGSLIRTTDGGNIVQFAHFTVHEYFQNDCSKHEKFRRYSLAGRNAQNIIGPLFLRYLTRRTPKWRLEATEEGVNTILQRIHKHPFYEHAALNWPRYATYNGDYQDCCPDLVRGFFSLSKTASFCSWSVEVIRHCLVLRRGDSKIFNWLKRGDFGTEPSIATSVIKAIMRPDFTPLHMAAAFGMPHLCEYLIQQGANVSLRSKFGTPLQCAIGSFSVFSDCQVLEAEYHGALRPNIMSPPARRQTVQLLLDAGSRTDLLLVTPFKQSTLLYLAVTSSMYGEDLEIAADLIKAGIPVEEEDLPAFSSAYNHAIRCWQPSLFKKKYLDGRSIIRLLEAVRNQGDEYSVECKLQKETLEFARHMQLDLWRENSQVPVVDEFNEEEAIHHLLSIINNNDVKGLTWFHQSNWSHLVGSVGINPKHPTWNALHLALHSGSLDTLEFLIEHGANLYQAAHDGKTPMHLISGNNDEDALRVFLNHGAKSTVADNDGRTIWHQSAIANSARILKVLVEFKERDEALRMVCRAGDTPIVAAVNAGSYTAAEFLAPYCKSAQFWKGGVSLYRAAARLGSHTVLDAMKDAQVPRDGEDGNTGNPLHFLSVSACPGSVRVLKELFSPKQRRDEDLQTPLESLLVRAARVLDSKCMEQDVLYELLPSTTLTEPSEASRLWVLVCKETIQLARDSRHARCWFETVVKKLVEYGIPKLYETHNQKSSMLPFVASIVEDVKDQNKILLPVEDDLDPLDILDLKLSILRSFASWGVPKSWEWFSSSFRDIARETSYWKSAAREPNMVRLLFQSIRNEDTRMMSLLLEKGVNIHARTENISPFEFACFPEIQLSGQDFDMLISFAKPETPISDGKRFHGCGPLHFIAGFQSTDEASEMKLRKLLQTGIDCNRPYSPKYGSPLAHYIKEGSFHAAELLLHSGADPWISSPGSMNPALIATLMGETALLQKISIVSGAKDVSNWDHRWSRKDECGCMTGGNALHLAAQSGKVECLEFYLNQGLLSDLEDGSKEFGTPLHHAAHYGQSEAVELLYARGAKVDTKNRFGRTPLHAAVYHGQLDTVRLLLHLGATQQECNQGCTPIGLAYEEGDDKIIETLQAYPNLLNTKDDCNIR